MKNHILANPKFQNDDHIIMVTSFYTSNLSHSHASLRPAPFNGQEAHKKTLSLPLTKAEAEQNPQAEQNPETATPIQVHKNIALPLNARKITQRRLI